MAARVLIIEDDPNVAEVVGRYLTREGYEVEIATDGAAGLERALADPPELVVLDLMLPTLGGLEVCRRLRAAAPVPVIILTALGRGDRPDRRPRARRRRLRGQAVLAPGADRPGEGRAAPGDGPAGGVGAGDPGRAAGRASSRST